MPHARSLLRFARRLTGDGHAAEDLVQESLLQAWRGFHRFRNGTNVRAWLFRILVNAFHSQGRKLRVSPVTVPLRDQISIAAGASALEKLEVMQALDDLPAEQRTVLLLGVVEGFTCREIAEILSVPIGTVMSRMSRARQSLRERLALEKYLATTVHSGKDIR